jgi:hypothetical protein
MPAPLVAAVPAVAVLPSPAALIALLESIRVRARQLAEDPDNPDPAAALRVEVEAVRGIAEVARGINK